LAGSWSVTTANTVGNFASFFPIRRRASGGGLVVAEATPMKMPGFAANFFQATLN
jgi:hypothetical protein